MKSIPYKYKNICFSERNHCIELYKTKIKANIHVIANVTVSENPIL
jgi:hypothetical protein